MLVDFYRILLFSSQIIAKFAIEFIIKMRLSKFVILVVLIACTWISISASTHYATIHNRFGSIIRCEGATISDDFLTLDNKTSVISILTDTATISSDHYRLQVRAANEHNSPRRSYTITDDNGNNHRINHPSWGVAFDINEDQTEYWAAILQCINTDINDDINDRRIANISLIHHHNGNDEMISSRQIDKDINLYDGFNSLEVIIRKNELMVSVGDDELNEVMRIAYEHNANTPVKVGCLVGAGAKVKIEREVIAFTKDETICQDTEWTMDRLKQYFEQSTDPVEGFWQYQDRDMEDRWLRLGGRYTLATVANDNGYDIIYLNGANTRSELWHTGMLKGRMTRTIFSNHYDLMWVDATLKPITQDAYATIENGVLLTLKFPVYKSQLRLSKILNP